jgi:hypothetical protein
VVIKLLQAACREHPVRTADEVEDKPEELKEEKRKRQTGWTKGVNGVKSADRKRNGVVR